MILKTISIIEKSDLLTSDAQIDQTTADFLKAGKWNTAFAPSGNGLVVQSAGGKKYTIHVTNGTIPFGELWVCSEVKMKFYPNSSQIVL